MLRCVSPAASLARALPPAALAVWDIAKRIEARRKAAALLDAWRTPSLPARVKIMVETPHPAQRLKQVLNHANGSPERRNQSRGLFKSL